MKTILFLLLIGATYANGSIMADGTSFFPVLVQVVDAKSGSPIRGATVRLEDLLEYHELEMDPAKITKVLPESLGKPVLTDDKGIAVVVYHGRWSSTTTNGKTTYGRALNGTIVVVHEGKEIFRAKLEEWVKENDAYPGAFSAPWIVVPFPPETKRRAQQAGTGQPATKPADKPSVKGQPSTPTSKDGPR